MKQNPCPVIGDVAKPTGIGFDELDGAVEAFSAGVADPVLAKVQQSFLMAPEHLDELFDRLQLAAHRVFIVSGATKVIRVRFQSIDICSSEITDTFNATHALPYALFMANKAVAPVKYAPSAIDTIAN